MGSAGPPQAALLPSGDERRAAAVKGLSFLDGNQNNDDKSNALYAVAVRPGG